MSGHFLGRAPDLVPAFVTGEANRGACLCVQVEGLAGYNVFACGFCRLRLDWVCGRAA